MQHLQIFLTNFSVIQYIKERLLTQFVEFIIVVLLWVYFSATDRTDLDVFFVVYYCQIVFYCFLYDWFNRSNDKGNCHQCMGCCANAMRIKGDKYYVN